MTNYILFVLLSFCSPEAKNPYCEIFGSIHEVEDPHKADYIVYEDYSETSADIIVFEQTNKFYADKPGMWYFEEDENFATYKIFFTDREREAHFSVFFTRFESFAGCNE